MAYKIKSKKSGISKKDEVSYIIAYEEGKLSKPEEIELFQKLEDSGEAYKLQGHYGRTATALIGAGLIKPNMKYHTKEEINRLKSQNKFNQSFVLL